MILVDSSIWIDQLAGRETAQTIALERLLIAEQEIGVGDLIKMEVLQGTRDERAFGAALAHLAGFEQVQISDHGTVEVATRHCRLLRERGVTIRRTIDVLIATRCLLGGYELLYRDRDFDPFVEHFGLRSALDLSHGLN